MVWASTEWYGYQQVQSGMGIHRVVWVSTGTEWYGYPQSGMGIHTLTALSKAEMSKPSTVPTGARNLYRLSKFTTGNMMATD